MEMNNLVEIRDNQVITSSRQVAEHFGKFHKDILENIRQVLAAENSATKFYHEVTFKNRGKQYPMYLMNRDGFSLLVMGFTGKKALEWKMKYIQAFNAMEAKLKKQFDDQIPKDLPSALIAYANALKELNQAKPKLDYYERILQTTNTMTITQVAADYGLSAIKLNRILNEAKFIRRVGKQWVLYSEYQNKGYTKSKTYEVLIGDDVRAYVATQWTQKGRLKIHQILTDLGYHAVCDEVKGEKVPSSANVLQKPQSLIN